MSELHYNVHLTVQADVVEAWTTYMHEHIDDVLATGCFDRAVFFTKDQPNAFVVSYITDEARFEKYTSEFAAALRKDPIDKFGGTFEAYREILRPIAR